MRSITAFEHQSLHVGKDFDDRVFRDLARYHDLVSDAYFDLGYHCIRLKQFVGILQVRELTIEVLPKIDRSESVPDSARWRSALIEMLAFSQTLDLRILPSASQSVGKASLLGLIGLQFARLVESLTREGLVRKYRVEQSNVSALKGKLLFPRHIQQNLVRPDRWFTDHTAFDREHALNGVLKSAIEVLYKVSTWSLRSRLAALLLHFVDVPRFFPDEGFLERVRYDRRTERYREPLQLAWLILQNLSPQISIGDQPIFALMFDMNKLFEKTVCRFLSREASSRRDGTQVLAQKSTRFWRRMTLRPDILIQRGNQRFILDTKWKLLGGALPNESDLRQVFSYGLYFGASKVILLYPTNGSDTALESNFAPIPTLPEFGLAVVVGFADLVTATGSLNGNFASRLFSNLLP